jgi:hypothetical protein
MREESEGRERRRGRGEGYHKNATIYTYTILSLKRTLRPASPPNTAPFPLMLLCSTPIDGARNECRRLCTPKGRESLTGTVRKQPAAGDGDEPPSDALAAAAPDSEPRADMPPAAAAAAAAEVPLVVLVPAWAGGCSWPEGSLSSGEGRGRLRLLELVRRPARCEGLVWRWWWWWLLLLLLVLMWWTGRLRLLNPPRCAAVSGLLEPPTRPKEPMPEPPPLSMICSAR